MTSVEQAYRAFHSQLSGFIARRLGGGEHVDDILQDVFVRVVRNNQSFAQADKPLAWLYAVTNSVLIDHYRKQGRAVDIAAGDVSKLAMPDDDPETEHGFGRCLLPLVDNLPQIYRDAVALTDLEGGRQTDYARKNNLNLATVKSRVQRGRKMLKNAVVGCCRVELDNRRSVIGLSPPTDENGTCC